MPLSSTIFAGQTQLEACLVNDSAHIQEGAAGEHVGRIQIALGILDGARIEGTELATRRFGPSTKSAVLSYKRARDIVAYERQSTADPIVGKRTIASLDAEMTARQVTISPPRRYGVSKRRVATSQLEIKALAKIRGLLAKPAGRHAPAKYR